MKILPGQVVKLVKALPGYVKVVGSIPSEGTCENQAMNTYISRTTNQPLSLQSINKKILKNKF